MVAQMPFEDPPHELHHLVRRGRQVAMGAWRALRMKLASDHTVLSTLHFCGKIFADVGATFKHNRLRDKRLQEAKGRGRVVLVQIQVDSVKLKCGDKSIRVPNSQPPPPGYKKTLEHIFQNTNMTHEHLLQTNSKQYGP